MKLMNQQELVKKIRSELIETATTRTIHRLMDAGMPSIPVGKRKLFNWDSVKAFILAEREQEPLVLAARGHIMERRYGKAS